MNAAGKVIANLFRLRRVWSPTFSPDAHRLAYAADTDRGTSVCVREPSTGWHKQLLEHPEPIERVLWSPAAKHLALQANTGRGFERSIILVDSQSGRIVKTIPTSASSVTLTPWSQTGTYCTFSANSMFADRMTIHVHNVNRNETAAVLTLNGIGQVVDFDDSQGRLLCYEIPDRINVRWLCHDLSSGATRPLVQNVLAGAGLCGAFTQESSVIIPDNSESQYAQIVKMSIPDNHNSQLDVICHAVDAELDTFAADASTDIGVVAWNEEGLSRLVCFDYKRRKELFLIPIEDLVVSEIVMSRCGSYAAIIGSSYRQPAQLMVLNTRSGAVQRFEDEAPSGVKLVKPTLVKFRSFDGTPLSGWLYLPREFGAPGPIVISFHGGPLAQERPTFKPLYQALLAEGIGVFAPNVRGSSGFGKTFASLDNKELRADAIRDVDSCIAIINQKGLSKPGMLGVMGGSYGAFLSLWAMINHNDAIVAGAVISVLSNLETFLSKTEPWMRAVSAMKYGCIDTDRALLFQLSPMNKISEIKAPLLLVHGSNDTNTPPQEATQVLEALLRRGVESNLIMFDNESHDVLLRTNQVTAAEGIVDWFVRHLIAGTT